MSKQKKVKLEKASKLVDPVLKILSREKLKATKPRINILSMLMTKHGPFTIEEIHKFITTSKPTAPVDLVTVYRCLAKFEALKIVRSCDFGDGSVRYEIEHEGHHHHHVICKKCGLIKTLEKCPVEQNPFQIKVEGFSEVYHKLEFFGICKKCAS